MAQSKDHWTHETYQASASFVPQLASKVVQWLNPQPSDVILDLGCGDGILTAQIKLQCAAVIGLDASANLIEAAKKHHEESRGIDWRVVDCRYLERDASLADATVDKVFSNAALHWILRDPTTRLSVLRAAYQSLKPGGTLVFEMGGAGNVADVHTALLAALVHQGLSAEQARDISPWFFPSEKLMRQMLEDVGFRVEKMQLEYRPTELTSGKDGGLKGWVRLMGANFLEAVPQKEMREAVVREVCDVLPTVLMHEEDGSMWMGYVRLRVAARK
ncbi:MAG: hypothetical protein Q9163_005777 [Psora crenata]